LWVIIRSGLLASPTSIVNNWLIGTIALATFRWNKFT
jgi:hypothetical protein